MGSRSNDTGRIYANAQSWAVISGYASGDRAVKALDAVNRMLATRNGIKLSWPGFNGYEPDKGGITTYPPGAKENGGIFLHSNPWVIIAETMVGNGVRAYEYYSRINPAGKNSLIEEYECEPYCYAQNILGDEHPQFGLARNSWLSGTASWAYQAAIKHILGVRPAYDGLLIDPCIPNGWKSYKVRKRFRNAVYDIQVKNPDQVSRGVAEVLLDGRLIRGNLLPLFEDGKVHSVEVLLGNDPYVSEGER